MKVKNIALAAVLFSFALSACANAEAPGQGTVNSKKSEVKESSNYDFSVKYDGIVVADISSRGIMVHDPSLVKDNGNYYIFGSHMTAAKSSDMVNWEMIGNGYSNTNPVYGQIFDVKDEAFRYSGARTSIIMTDDSKTHVWAPDVIYNKTTGKYNMYYCTTSTWNASNLCFGVADSIEGPYVWTAPLIYSGFSSKNIGDTDVLEYVDEEYVKKNYFKNGGYNFEDYPNAIDPTVFYDKDDKLWMVYGSFSGGIFLLELNPESGYPIHPESNPDENVDTYFGKRLLGGGHISIEGPYIVYDTESDYYYLFVSYGSLLSDGGYQIRVFRSKTVDGDYVDMNGQYPNKNARHQNFGLKLSGNYNIPSLEKAYMATGHNSAFIDDDGRKYIAYHTRFDDKGEGHSPRVHQYILNEEGWPCELPYQTQGESAEKNGYSKDKLSGRYFVVNQGTEIDNAIANPEIIYLNEDGTTASKDSSGVWSAKDGSYYMTITIGDIEYKGVFCEMPDEAGTKVMTFSAVGNNQSVWGIKY